MTIKNSLLLQSLPLLKNPQHLFSSIKRISNDLFKFDIKPCSGAGIEFEKLLLSSALLLSFDIKKDMKSRFISDYIDVVSKDFVKFYDSEDLINLFENSGCGVSFMNVPDSERKYEAYDSLKEYILARLILYKRFFAECANNLYDNLDVLFYVIYHRSFSVFRYNTKLEFDEVKFDFENYCFDDEKIPFESFKSEIITLSKSKFFNFVKISTASNYYTKQSSTFHTEGQLPFLKLRENKQYLSFSRISGCGKITCKRCRYSEQIIAFLHGSFNASIGRQCPECGFFSVEENKSKEYHCFGPSTEDYNCPKCGYVIRKKEESIFKGNANPLFCPKCHSTDLSFDTEF